MDTAIDFNPLLEVGVHYIRETVPTATHEQLSILRKTMDLFINGSISYDNATNIFKNHIETSHPLEKIHSVLLVDDIPLIPEPEVNTPNSLSAFSQQTRKKTSTKTTK